MKELQTCDIKMNRHDEYYKGSVFGILKKRKPKNLY